MKKIKLLITSFLFFLLNNNYILAGTRATTFDIKHQDQLYAGLVWTLQEKMSALPDFLTIGYRSLRVKSSDKADGADASLRFKLKESFIFDSARLSYVDGNRDSLINYGVGYSYANSSLLGTLALQGPYARIGTDYFLNNKFLPYFEIITLDSPKNVPLKEMTPP